MDAIHKPAGAEGVSFNELLATMKSRGALSNHRSLRAYLDLLVASKAVSVTKVPAKSPNVRMKEVYEPAGREPAVVTGWEAMDEYGIGWEVPQEERRTAHTDLEGAGRAVLRSGVLYASLEDLVVDTLRRAGGKEEKALALTYTAALMATDPLDEAYLVRRAREAGVSAEVEEMLAEIRALFYAPKVPAGDVKALFSVRRAGSPLRREAATRRPRWTVLSPDALLDAVGKQLGAK